MIYILLFIVGAAIAASVMTITSQRNMAQKNSENNLLSSQLAAKQQETDMLRKQLNEQNEKQQRQTEYLKEAHQQQLNMLTAQHLQQDKELKNMYEAQISDLKTRHEKEMNEQKALMEKQLNDRLTLIQEQMKSATDQMLKQRSAELDQSNRTQIGSILEPLKAVMADMKKSMDDSRDSFTRNTTTLGEQIKQMYETTRSLGTEAEKLSKALQTGPKIQGDFGEMKLNDLLDKFGFTKGIEYDVQYTMRDEKGNVIRNDDTDNKMRPDVVLHYPDHKDVVIDSKASLTAFINYVNADNDADRKRWLEDHVKSVRRHIDELANKRYDKYAMEGGTTLNFVIMFVPQEAAMQLALSADAQLWNYAFDTNVLITGEQNLFALLRLLQMAWTQQRQAENQEQVFGLANTLIERVGLFVERFDKIGKCLDTTQKAFDDAQKSMRGNQSFIVSARRLVEMGARENPKRPLPATDPDGILPFAES